MLDEEEYRVAHELYGQGIRTMKGTREERFKPLLDYYFKVTGEREAEPNAIMHHQVDLYGSPCESCGKPYRTSKATFCAACGHKRLIKQ